MQSKRPIGMTILLVLSFINACIQILGNLSLFVNLPMLKEMYQNGAMESMLTPFLETLSDDSSKEAFNAEIALMLSINRIYYLLLSSLYVGSLVGVLKMFKLQRLGFHIYSIAQMLILIVGVIFIYSKQANAGFLSAFVTTICLILIYHLYLKRIEMANTQLNSDNDEGAQGE